MKVPLRIMPGSISRPIKLAHSHLHRILFSLSLVILTLLTTSGSASSTQGATAAAEARTVSPLIFTIPSTPILPNPAVLPHSTHATLHSLDTFRSAPLLSRSNAFAFAGLTPGSYIFRVHALDYAFEVLRVDIGVDGVEGAGSKKRKTEVEGGLKVQAWQTFIGHAWDNKGELRGEGWIGVIGGDKDVGKYSEGDGREGSWRVSASEVSARIAVAGGGGNSNSNSNGNGNSNGTGDRAGSVVIEVRPVSVLNYYQARSEFSVFSVFKNPMTLLALVSLALVVGVPYLIDNMDPETKADFQKMQAESRSSLPTQSAAASQLKDFDVASWLAGRPSASATGASVSTGSSNGSDKKKK